MTLMPVDAGALCSVVGIQRLDSWSRSRYIALSTCIQAAPFVAAARLVVTEHCHVAIAKELGRPTYLSPSRKHHADDKGAGRGRPTMNFWSVSQTSNVWSENLIYIFRFGAVLAFS